jgi:hypothetical protein
MVGRGNKEAAKSSLIKLYSAMKKHPKTYLYNLPKSKNNKENLRLLRLILHADYLKVDFGYYTTDYYIKGGWVRIAQDSFVRDNSSKKIYKLIRAENIPIAPSVHSFNSSNEWMFFSLIFEPIPFTLKQFDLIEVEPGAATDFNFYNIVLDSKNAMELLS